MILLYIFFLSQLSRFVRNAIFDLIFYTISLFYTKGLVIMASIKCLQCFFYIKIESNPKTRRINKISVYLK